MLAVEPNTTMATNRLILEYPKGVSLHVALVDASGNPINSFEFVPPVLLRLGSQLEFLGATSGNIKTLLDLSSSEEDEDDDNDADDADEGLDSDEAMLTDSEESEETTIGNGNDTIDLISDSDEDEDVDSNDDDVIVVTHSVG